jgi:hypothetical protein
MHKSRPRDMDALLRAQVERAVAPYVGLVPPWMLGKLRELAERYWREQPEAARVLAMMGRRQQQVRSGTVALVQDDEDDQAANGEGEG